MPDEETSIPVCCTVCQGRLVPAPDEWRLPGRMCPTCRRYYPSPEESASVRALFARWRDLLLVVAGLHRLGYELARVVPWIEDTPGGGDWHCIIAPADMISPSHGAEIDERISWWGGDNPPGRDLPYVIGRGWRDLPVLPPSFASAGDLVANFPKLAESSFGRDASYVGWYRETLEATGPDGVIYTSAPWDRDDPPVSQVRALGPEGRREVQFLPPPPGTASSSL